MDTLRPFLAQGLREFGVFSGSGAGRPGIKAYAPGLSV